MFLMLTESSADFGLVKTDIVWTQGNGDVIDYKVLSDRSSKRSWTIVHKSEDNWIWWPRQVEFPLEAITSLVFFEGMLDGKPVSTNPLTSALPGKADAAKKTAID